MQWSRFLDIRKAQLIMLSTSKSYLIEQCPILKFLMMIFLNTTNKNIAFPELTIVFEEHFEMNVQEEHFKMDKKKGLSFVISVGIFLEITRTKKNLLIWIEVEGVVMGYDNIA